VWSKYSSNVLLAVRDAQEEGLANILRAVLAGSGSTTPSGKTLDLDRGYESVRRFLERQGSPNALGTPDQFRRRFAQDKSLQNVVRDILKIEQTIDQAMTPQRELERLTQKLYGGGKTVSFGDQAIVVEDSKGKQISLASLSSGEKHLVRLFVESLIAQDNAILIDEPEISLHVDWQRELVADFRTLNSEAQFVLATHSPEIMAEISDDRIFAL
jgi:hypothetical protein